MSNIKTFSEWIKDEVTFSDECLQSMQVGYEAGIKEATSHFQKGEDLSGISVAGMPMTIEHVAELLNKHVIEISQKNKEVCELEARILAIEEKKNFLEKSLEKAEDVIRFYQAGYHLKVSNTRGEVIDFDVDAGPLYNTITTLEDIDRGEKARQYFKEKQDQLKGDE